MTDKPSDVEVEMVAEAEAAAGEQLRQETVEADESSGGRWGAEREAELLGLPPRSLVRDALRATPSWLLSTVLHMVVFLVLAMVYLPPQVPDDMRELIAATSNVDQLEEVEDFDDQPLEDLDVTVTDDMILESVVEPEDVQISEFDEPAAAVAVQLNDFGLEQAPRNDLLAAVGAYSGDALSGRGKGKARLVARVGGNEASEKAVALALQWLAAHQMPDGGWNFDHTLAPKCRGQCRNPGELTQARNAATGLALLPFLGAGQTHKEGMYKEVVRKGLYFLVTRMQVSPKGGSLFEPQGRMYSHGIGSIALCEAYAMTHDKGLYVATQQALKYICMAQDPIGGGWRYEWQQPGDTSVVGWQIMALKSGHMAYLEIPSITIQKASMFLDTVQGKGGARYGYTTPATDRPSTTAIGLLCRMYLGWPHDQPALVEGVKWLSEQGPSPTNMYYNYYATQVMRHYGGEAWDKWNAVMRDQLVKSQSKKGHETGSWYLSNPHGGLQEQSGGRLYCTSMATMVLEVYYRHLPIYRKQSTQDKFPID